MRRQLLRWPWRGQGVAVGQFIKDGWKAPAWYVTVPLGVYTFILGVFVVRKGAEYYMDSRFNSPQDKPPEKKDGG